MDIPREAVLAAAQARLGPSPRLEGMSESALAYELNKTEEQLEAAAPIIARAAQVEVLQELKEKWGKSPPCCEWGGSEYYDVQARLAALEAGAGQAEVRDGA